MKNKLNLGGFIKALTHKAIRAATGVSKSAPGNWVADGAIPPRYYPIFQTLCLEAKIECERRFFGFAEAPGP